MIPNDTSAASFDISTIANRYGVTLRTLRFYEARGLLSPTRSGTTRLYSAKDCRRLELILKGKKLGFSLGEIERLIRGGSPSAAHDAFFITDRMTSQRVKDQLAALCNKRAKIDAAISELEAALKRDPDG